MPPPSLKSWRGWHFVCRISPALSSARTQPHTNIYSDIYDTHTIILARRVLLILFAFNLKPRWLALRSTRLIGRKQQLAFRFSENGVRMANKVNLHAKRLANLYNIDWNHILIYSFVQQGSSTIEPGCENAKTFLQPQFLSRKLNHRSACLRVYSNNLLIWVPFRACFSLCPSAFNRYSQVINHSTGGSPSSEYIAHSRREVARFVWHPSQHTIIIWIIIHCTNTYILHNHNLMEHSPEVTRASLHEPTTKRAWQWQWTEQVRSFRCRV